MYDTGADLACTVCGTTTPRPEPLEWSPLWDAGWRWRAAAERAGKAGFVPRARVYSCPNCPSVLDHYPHEAEAPDPHAAVGA